MSKQYLLTKSEIKLIIESAISEFNQTMDYAKAIEYGIERLHNILATNETGSTRGNADEHISRPTKENAPTTDADIREVLTNENHFTNEQKIGED